tara:strand:- start:500 stop:754 length:255 start_codon:yes stop_codon:yes gene_type:complete
MFGFLKSFGGKRRRATQNEPAVVIVEDTSSSSDGSVNMEKVKGKEKKDDEPLSHREIVEMARATNVKGMSLPSFQSIMEILLFL